MGKEDYDLDDPSDKYRLKFNKELSRKQKIAHYKTPDYCIVTRADTLNILRLELDSLVKDDRDKMVNVSSKHIDGSMRAPERDELMSWLKSTSADSNECRVLTNVRCLSEGVDVPSLDSVMFLSARNCIRFPQG